MFTRRERSANKYAFSCRLVFWRVVTGLCARGRTSDVAIDMVYRAYGRNLGVTEILLRMRKDWREQGSHPELRA